MILWKNAEDCHKSWFLEWFKNLTDSNLEKILRFWTGHQFISCDTKLLIRIEAKSDEYIPTSKTCFNELILSDYSSKEIMNKKMNQMLELCDGSFGLD